MTSIDPKPMSEAEFAYSFWFDVHDECETQHTAMLGQSRVAVIEANPYEGTITVHSFDNVRLARMWTSPREYDPDNVGIAYFIVGADIEQ